MTADPEFSLRRIAVPAYGPTLLFGIGEGAVLPVLALTARDLGASVPTAAFVMTVLALASLIFNLPASIITDRFGERWSIVGAALVGVVAAGMFALAQSLPLLFVGAVLLGTSEAVFMLARQKYLTEAVPIRLRARALSTLGGVYRIGVFVGPFLGAGVIALWGMRASYLVCVAALLAAFLMSIFLPDVGSAVRASAEHTTMRKVAVDHRRVLLTVGFGVLLVALVRAARQAVIPLWADHLGLDAQTASTIYGLSGGVDMLVFYPAGKIMDTFGRRWVTVPSMLVMGVSFLLIPLTSGAVTFTLVACLLGFGNGIGSGMIMTLGADFSPDVGRAQFLGLWRTVSDLGKVSGPAVLSALTAAWALPVAVGGVGLAGLLGALVMWRTVPPRVKA